MGRFDLVKKEIDGNIKQNGSQSITGKVMNMVLNDMLKASEDIDIDLQKLVVEMPKKANNDGIYPSMTSGFASNLVGRGESVPAEFSFRASGGKSIQDGTARMKVLHGNAVVWNQGLKNSFIASESSFILEGDKYVITPSGEYPGIKSIEDIIPIVGHRYILLCDKMGGSSPLCLNWGGFNDRLSNPVFEVTNKDKTNFTIFAMVESSTFLLTIPRLIDLTLMFGAGNEPLTIEEFNARKPIVADEYAYNEGEVIAFTAEGIKSVGDNAWDEEWEVGGFDGNGEPANYANRFRSKNYIDVLANAEYYSNRYLTIFFYNADKEFISYMDMNSTTFTTPSNCRYLKFYLYGEEKYNDDVIISLYHSGWKAEGAKYQPYWEDIRKIDTRIKEAFPDGMNKWDKVYNKNGKGYIVKGTGVADLGASSWYNGGVSPNGLIQWKFTRQDINLINVNESITAKYSRTDWWDLLDNGKDMSYAAVNDSGNTYFCVIDSRYTDAASFKAAMAGVMLYYELAEPTIIEYDEPFNLDYEVADFGTEEIIASKPSAPIKADIVYQFNAVDMIRENYNEIQQLKAMLINLQTQMASMVVTTGEE